MFHKSGRVLVAALAVGAALFVGGCAAGTGSAPHPQPPSIDTASGGSIASDSEATQNSDSSSTTSESPDTGKNTETGKNTNTSSRDGKDSGNGTGSTSSTQKEIQLTTYTPDGTTTKFVTSPKELILPDSASGGASDVQFKNITWNYWGDNGAEGNGDAYVTGGGAPPETIHNVQIIVDNPQMVSGTRQYTHFLIMYPDGTHNEGEITF
ncbi:hypothetical protein AB0I53_00760 [Saccharopolyspora sp. NPDC050389]|uniref:hypothetical protein n=1 Tax=Saccharopolyspora sp. NPDC050389 TaxID=3155516 RepID=UPI00340CC2D9